MKMNSLNIQTVSNVMTGWIQTRRIRDWKFSLVQAMTLVFRQSTVCKRTLASLDRRRKAPRLRIERLEFRNLLASWARSFGGTYFNDDARASVYSSEPTGNFLYVTGIFSGTVNFGGTAGNLTSAGAAADIFLVKLDVTNGNTVWAKGIGGSSSTIPTDIVTTHDLATNTDKVHVTGRFEGTTDFDPGPGTVSLTPVGTVANLEFDGFLLTLDTNGNYVSVWQFGGSGSDGGESLETDGTSLFLAGNVAGTVDLDPGPGVQNASGYFIDKYANSTSASPTWVQSTNGVFYVAGEGDALYLTGRNALGATVAKYAKATGALVWAKQFSGSGTSGAANIIVDPLTGSLYVTGYFYSSINFNPGGVGGEVSPLGLSDAFLLKLNSTSGDYQQVTRMGGTGYTRARVLGLRGTTLYVSGFFEAVANFPTGGTLTSSGGKDIFLMALDQANNVNLPVVLTSSLANVTGNVLSTLTNNGTWSDPESQNSLVTLTASLGDVVKNANGTWSWSLVPSTKLVGQQITIMANDGTNLSSVTFTVDALVAVSNRQVYYKGSSFASIVVDNALAPNKVLAQSGAAPQTLNYSNLINTTRGINGIVLDVAGLASASLTASDFAIRVSPTGFFDEAANPPSSWAAAPAPTGIFVTPGTATTPARVRLEWADNAIENRWLQIRILANANTGLLSSQVYYLGHLRGEINGQTIGGAYFVNNADLTAALPVGQAATVGNTRDVDKNGFVLNADFIIIRLGIINGLVLQNITIPVAGSANEGAFGMRPSAGMSPLPPITPIFVATPRSATVGSDWRTSARQPTALFQYECLILKQKNELWSVELRVRIGPLALGTGHFDGFLNFWHNL